MTKLYFDNLQELDDLFKQEAVEITQSILDSIQQAADSKKKTADLFEVQIEGLDTIMDITLPKSQWGVALETCLKHFEKWGMADQAIDTYLLTKQIQDESRKTTA